MTETIGISKAYPRRLSFRLLAIAVLLGASTTLARAADPPCQPEVWAESIENFVQEDAKSPPPRDAIVFVGSSSIRLWDLKKSFPDLEAINRGFGGSQLCDAVHYVEPLVLRHAPRTVVLYAGDNDLAAGKSPEQVHRDFENFIASVHKALPETRILYISIKPSIARWKLAGRMREANSRIAATCQKNDKLHFIDVWPAMLDKQGRPRQDLLRDDNLHLNDAGYEAWTKLVRPHLEQPKK